jgi:hypothetical protein
MIETPQYFEEDDQPHWYDRPWLVTFIFILFFPVGIYGLIKSNDKKGIVWRLVGIVAIAIFVLAGDSKRGSTFSGFDTVTNSQWDGSVDVAERYLKNNLLRDPSSYESIRWSKVSTNPDGSYKVTHTYRARNGFGGMGKETTTFIISKDGSRVINYY